MSGVCTTIEELACVCLDPHGREVGFQCVGISEGGLEGAGLTCLPEDSLCDSTPDACCEGLTCMQGLGADGTQVLGLCKQACIADEECTDTLCCASTPDVAGNYCAQRSLCVAECGRLDEECDSNRHPCCEGLVCAQSPNDLSLMGCQLPCTKNTQCETGCCLRFDLPGGMVSDQGVCAPLDRCAAQGG